MVLRIETLTGAALEAALDDVARLRIAVFRDWPYLYDGDLAYEQRYMATYRDSASAIVVGAFDGDRLVGASTGTPLADHADDFARPFSGTGIDLNEVFYCAESVLLPEYRGQGAGHGFFEHREAHARALGFKKSAFCGVQRPADHPMRPVTTPRLTRSGANVVTHRSPVLWLSSAGKISATQAKPKSRCNFGSATSDYRHRPMHRECTPGVRMSPPCFRPEGQRRPA